MKKLPTSQDKIVAYNEPIGRWPFSVTTSGPPPAAAATGLGESGSPGAAQEPADGKLQSWKGLSSKKIPLHSGEDPSKKAAELVDRAKQMQNEAKITRPTTKVAARRRPTVSAMDKRRQANKAKQAEAHKFKNTSGRGRIDKRSRCGRRK